MLFTNVLNIYSMYSTILLTHDVLVHTIVTIESTYIHNTTPDINLANICLIHKYVIIQDWLRDRLRGEIIEDMKFDDYPEEEENPVQEVIEEASPTGSQDHPQLEGHDAHFLLPSSTVAPAIDW